ncbi:hypothetical protein Tco_0845306, partial [Tanacetum coccineum]
TYHAALTKLIKQVKKLEQTIKISQARRRAKVFIYDAEEDGEDPSKQGRSLIKELDLDTGISLVPPHAADQGRIDDTQISDQPEEQLGVFSATTALADAARRRQSVENVKTYIIRNRLISTVDVSTASELGSTAGVKAKDKGKAIMQESEPPKKIKKRVQVQMSVDDELAKKEKSKKTLSEESAKKQKLEDDTEKEELQVYLNIVPEEESLNIESLATKYPIVDRETQILANDKIYYQIKRADGSVKHYKIFSAMLYDFDRQDVLELYRLVNEIFQTASPEVIHMMVEKKYPLSQDTLSKMLNRRLEVDHQSEMGYELISLDLSRLATTLKRLERSIQTRINSSRDDAMIFGDDVKVADIKKPIEDYAG